MRGRPITYYLDGRLYEWIMATAMIELGIAILTWPRIAYGSILQVTLQYIPAPAVAFVFLVVGMSRMAALIANGNSLRIGPRIRSWCAIMTAVLWAQFAFSMGRVSIEQGFPSPMVFFWASFTFAEIYIAYRAVLDVRAN